MNAAAALVAAALAFAAHAQSSALPLPGAEPAPSPVELRTSPEIAPDTPRPATPKAATPATPALVVPGMPKPPAAALPSVLPAGANPLAGASSDGAIFVRADRIETNGRKMVEAFGKVELRAKGQTVLADHLLYDVDQQTVDADGDVTLRKGLDWITGPKLRFKRDTQTGFFVSPRYYFAEVGGRGDAARIEFKGPNLYEVTDGRYTTCVAPRNDWFLQTRELELDRTRNVGIAHDATVRFFETPIFYSPYLEFPLSNERKSGFLTPTAGSTGTRGLELATPYYLNLAPNYDATLTPRVMTRRGVQLGGQLRYLFGDPQPMAGEIDAEILPDDRVTGTNRYALSWRHSQQFTPWLTGYVNLNKVSDDTYFADLADRIAITSQETLPREAGLNAAFGPLSASLHVVSFQTLQDPTQPIAPPYNELPQILANYADTEFLGLTFSGAAEYTQFRNAVQPNGDRAVIYPQVAWSRQGSSWFFTARESLNMRWYSLETPASGTDAHPAVYVPITSVDSGLIFERDWSLFGHDYIHTLEPRAFYVYIPYRNQNSLPVFDTAQDDFNFSQLFTENRYLGNDRIGDANQLTLAVTSRLLDPDTGAERLSVSLGQRFYFSDQRVTLAEQPRSSSSSDILLQVQGKLSNTWALEGLVQQNLDAGVNEQLNLGVRYTPALGAALNASYRYTRLLADPAGGAETLKQFDLSGEWPVTPNWTLLGRWNYSLQDKKTLEAIAGVEYNRDCWILRLVFHRLATTTEQTTNSVFVQLELNGLARIGTSPLDLLRRSVPGYLRTNDPSLVSHDPRLDPMSEF
ncbi:MAG: LPS assembly protein LptD [Casimicrobiaceae bacterium]